MFMCMPVARLWSGWLRPRGEGDNRNPRINPMQGKLPMHLSRRADKARDPVPVAVDAKRPLPDARRTAADASDLVLWGGLETRRGRFNRSFC